MEDKIKTGATFNTPQPTVVAQADERLSYRVDEYLHDGQFGNLVGFFSTAEAAKAAVTGYELERYPREREPHEVITAFIGEASMEGWPEDLDSGIVSITYFFPEA